MSDKLRTREQPLDNARAAWRRASRRASRSVWLRTLLMGLALAMLIAGLALAVGVVWMNDARFAEEAVRAGRDFSIAGGLLAGLTLLGFAVRWLGPMAVAKRVEARDGTCDGLLLTAAELDASRRSGRSVAASTVLSARVFRRAGEYLAGDSPWRQDERRARRRAAGTCLVIPAAFAAIALLGPAWLTTGLGLVINPHVQAQAVNPYALSVAPGDVTVLEGADQRIVATPSGFEAQQMVLEVRAAGADAWRQAPMAKTPDGVGFEALLLRLDASSEYRVVADGLDSQVHQIEVVPRPRVARIELEYRYPEHTGAPVRRVEDGGDIKAVEGTRVTIRVHPDRASGAATLNFGGGGSLELRESGGAWAAELTVRSDDHYRVELAAPEGGGLAPASPEYAIAALSDGLPSVSLLRPGADAKVTSVEEVEIRVAAADDVSVRAVEVVMSVNGGAEQTIALHEGLRDITSQARTDSHTLYLEDMSMQPGDLIAYYARVRDSERASREVKSDIFFLEVRPFERRYRRARGGGGSGGGGQQGGGDAMLAAQQKALVIALFKLVRDRAVIEATEHSDQVDLLAGAQERIRERVDAIARRLGQRAIVDMEPGYRRMAEELPLASTAMLKVETMLAIADTEQALPQARQALLHLQRADAAFREVQVAQASRGGGGGRAQANDLANLFKLEMDSFKSQYAHVRRARAQARSQQIDETMRRLEELARRQERALREAQAQLGRSDGAGGGSSRALVEQAEEILRTLERLSRKRPDPRLEDSARRMREAVQSMREAGGGQGSQAQARQRAAIESLREARRLLEEMGPRRLADAVRSARDSAKALETRQTEVTQGKVGEPSAADAEKVASEGEGDAPPGGDARRRTLQAKSEMLSDVQDLQGEIDAATRQAAKQGGEVGRELRGAQTTLRRNDVVGEIERSARALAGGADPSGEAKREARIGKALTDTRQRLDAALEHAEAAEDGRARAAARLSDVTRRLAGLRDGRGSQEKDPAQGGESGARGASSDRNEDGKSGQGKRGQGKPGQRAAAGQGRDGAERGQAKGDGGRPGDGKGKANGEGRQRQGGEQLAEGGQGQGQAQGDGRAEGASASSRQSAGDGGRGPRQGQGRSDGQGGEVTGIAAGGGNQRSGIALGGALGGAFGGGRFGVDSNVDLGGVREGLRGSVDELRDIMRSFAPGGTEAQDISTVIRGLEGLMDGSEKAIGGRFGDLVATLQGIERSVRDAERDAPALLSASGEAVVPNTYRAKVDDYFRRLGSAKSGAGL